jgi:hypothetical protein
MTSLTSSFRRRYLHHPSFDSNIKSQRDLATLFETESRMYHLTYAPMLRLMIVLLAASLFTSTLAKHPSNRRSDLQNVPPVSDSGYEVPLTGSQTCVTAANCKLPVLVNVWYS